MTTARDLLITALDTESGRLPERGEMSLALAGAELIDLLAAEAIALDGDRIVPGLVPETGDRLLDEASSALVRQTPHESVEDWLWRRGRELSSQYLAALEAEGLLTGQRRRRFFRTGRTVPADSPDRRRAASRWASDEPVLVALAASVGIPGERRGEFSEVADEGVETVLAAVNDALTELEAVRQRRAIEKAAFDNIWRGE